MNPESGKELTGRIRHRDSQWPFRDRLVLQVEERSWRVYYIAGDAESAAVLRWRDATLQDLITVKIMGGLLSAKRV